jgi:hypothetical protein
VIRMSTAYGSSPVRRFGSGAPWSVVAAGELRESLLAALDWRPGHLDGVLRKP